MVAPQKRSRKKLSSSNAVSTRSPGMANSDVIFFLASDSYLRSNSKRVRTRAAIPANIVIKHNKAASPKRNRDGFETDSQRSDMFASVSICELMLRMRAERGGIVM